MQTMKVELIINGKSVAVGHQFLEDIVRDIPDILENKAVFVTLVQSDNPEVRETISRKDNLSNKTVHLLLRDESQDVVDNVLSNTYLAKRIKEEALLDLIKTDNIKYLTIIASNLDSYELCNPCDIAMILSKHNNSAVRAALLSWGGH
jgi:hypothetical protein